MTTLQKSFNWLNNLSWTNVVLIGVALMGGAFLWQNYREQLYPYLPYLIILLCPLMHIFMHKGHGGNGDHDDHGKE